MSIVKKGKKPANLEQFCHWMKGRKHSEETRKKISLALTGKKLSPEHIEKMAKSKRGKH